MPKTQEDILSSAREHSLKGNLIRDDSYSSKPGLTLYTSAISALVAAFQYGWMVSEINVANFDTDCGLNDNKECVFFPGHTKFSYTAATSGWIIGGAIGALLCGAFADKYGRKKTLTLNAIVMSIGGLVQGISSSIWMFALGRLISGISSGAGTTVAACFIAEISPPKMRGTLGTGLQMSIVSGIFIVNLVIFGLGTASGWHYLVAFPLLLGIIQLGLSPLMVESPRWLVSKGLKERAKKELKRLFPNDDPAPLLYDICAQQDIMVAASTPRRDAQVRPVGKVEPHTHPILQLVTSQYRRQLAIAIGLSLFQQLSGINAVFFYSSKFFKDAHVNDPRVGNSLTALVNALATAVAVKVMDSYNRRTLLNFCCYGMLFSTIGITVCLLIHASTLSIVLTCLYVMFFEFGLGPMPWMISAEIFPEEIRAHASSVAIGTNWMATLVVAAAYPSVQRALQNFSFVPFIIVLCFSLLFVRYVVPETRNKSLEEIQREFIKLETPKEAA